jgi:hypothetical protein
MNWYQKFKTSGYSSELGYLKNYLKHGFDPYDFAYELKEYLETFDPDEVHLPEGWENEEGYDIIEDWMKIATPKDIEKFEEYVGHNTADRDQYDQPAYTALDFTRLAKPQWLVHFTNDAQSIKNKGFVYGHEDFIGLHLTTYKTEKARFRNPGYNFAFEMGDRNARSASRSGKYGKECVVFWGAAVEAWHSGDEESQMIFWGPAINKDMIFVLVTDPNTGDWCVPSEVKDCVMKGGFEDCCTWIENNYRMLQQIAQKRKNYHRERDIQRKKRLEKENLAYTR